MKIYDFKSHSGRWVVYKMYVYFFTVRKTENKRLTYPSAQERHPCLFSPARPSGVASRSSLHLAATGLLGATLLHQLAVSAGFGPTESLAVATATASGLGVPLARSPASSLTGVAAMQQSQGKKRGRPPKDQAELSNNPRFKRQREYQHGLASEKRKAERLKRNERAARCHARKAVKKTEDWLKAMVEKWLELEQANEDEVVCVRYVFSM